jgi:hypothetical protein
MESLSRENEKVPAVGNMKVNAKGDQINRGLVTKTADQLAREHHRVQSVVVNTGLKGEQPAAPDIQLEAPKPAKNVKAAIKEKELPSGDIIVESENDKS